MSAMSQMQVQMMMMKAQVAGRKRPSVHAEIGHPPLPLAQPLAKKKRSDPSPVRGIEVRPGDVLHR
ncbi:MAG: hypothetical protein CBC65_000885 [Rhodothermaceae bacterium TMED105]|nr:MAG: hypothetical protein CBC65_000885 [Rhodothermaceae bacterium TMED105]|tara:strand:+ start:5306 stop:5503 length:198 start_codon:yes stop_codon:yes gene_type:complete